MRPKTHQVFPKTITCARPPPAGPARVEAPPSNPCRRLVFGRKRCQVGPGVPEEYIGFVAGDRTAAPLDHDRSLHDVRDRDAATDRCKEHRLLSLRVKLPVRDCRQGRGLNDHPDRPRLPWSMSPCSSADGPGPISSVRRSAMTRSSRARISVMRKRFPRSRRSCYAVVIVPVTVLPISAAGSPARRQVSLFLMFRLIAVPGRQIRGFLPKVP